MRPWFSYRGVKHGSDLEFVLSSQLDTAEPVPVDYFVKVLGISVEDGAPIDKHCIVDVRGDDATFWLRGMPEEERRYWLGYGLGRLLGGTRDAGKFSRSLLMPIAAWVRAVDEYAGDVEKLAFHFMVPTWLIEDRLADGVH